MLDLVGYIILTSLSWNVGSLLIKQGLYDTPPISSMLMKSLIFFLVSVGLAVFYFLYKKKRVDIKKLKRGFKYFIPAVALTYFIGTFLLLNLLNKSEKISVAIFLMHLRILRKKLLKWYLRILFVPSILTFFFTYFSSQFIPTFEWQILTILWILLTGFSVFLILIVYNRPLITVKY